MSAVKALALSALVVAAAAQSAMAGALDRADLSWVTWTPAGVIETPATTPAPGPATTASLFGLGTFPDASPLPPPAPAAPVPAPVMSTATVPTAIQAAVPVAAPASAPTTAPTTYDAFVNLGAGPYPDASNLTTGGAQAWYNSPAVIRLFGGQVSAQDQASFTSTVLQHVEQTFAQSGVPVTLTADPNAPAAHTLSVVTGTISTWGPVLGLTNVGGNGFDFINVAAKSSQSVDQLEWVVAHNVSHELMLAFSVPENYDQTGNFIDARDANLSMMLNPKATFSQSAAQALLAQSFLGNNEGSSAGPQMIGAQTVVPEPSTVAAWTFALGGFALVRRRPRPAA